MKLIYSLFMLVILSLLAEKLSTFEEPLLTACEMREVNLRLDSIKYL